MNGRLESTQIVLQHAEELAALELFPAPHGQYFRDWCLSELGQVQEGTTPLTEALSDFRAKGLLRFVPFYLMLLAEVLEHKRHRASALERLDEALHLLERTQERWCEAELYRRKGELLGLEGNLEAAETCLGKALTVARQQSAKIWELRASTSLARLWRDQGKRVEARDLLGLWLRLVHGGLRYVAFARCPGAARGAERAQWLPIGRRTDQS